MERKCIKRGNDNRKNFSIHIAYNDLKLIFSITYYKNILAQR
jgi:hypothetical protein